MRIGLVDADAESRGKVTFPNLALMKISAWHKAQGDTVEWYRPMFSGHMDRVYLSKVFSEEYTMDFPWAIDADEVIKGGSGYAIKVTNGREVHNKQEDTALPYEVEHIFPDYHLYQKKIYVPDIDDDGEETGTGYYETVDAFPDTAYGFLTRGCPRGCDFCHVASMQGRKVHTVARLSEFWNGQKNIELLDPNITASQDWAMHMEDIAKSGATVSFNQGLDIGLITPQKIEDLNNIKWKRIHFAWDRVEDEYSGRFRMVMAKLKGANRNRVTAYVLTNNGSTLEQDLHRIYELAACDIQPYVMIYRKATAPKVTRQLQRWVNNPMLFWSCGTFDEYLRRGI